MPAAPISSAIIMGHWKDNGRDPSHCATCLDVADRQLVQQVAETYWAAAASRNPALCTSRTPVYEHLGQALRAAIREVYGLSDLMARRVHRLLSFYGPDDSLTGTTGSGIESYVQSVLADRGRDWNARTDH